MSPLKTLRVVVVAQLHHLVADPERPGSPARRAGRPYGVQQRPASSALGWPTPSRPRVHGREHLDVAARVEAELVRDALGATRAWSVAAIGLGLSRSMKKKSRLRARCSSGMSAVVDAVGVDDDAGSRCPGGRCAVSRTDVGDARARCRSRRTAPGPTEGSWSTSPTSRRCARSGSALSSVVGEHQRRSSRSRRRRPGRRRAGSRRRGRTRTSSG